VLGRELEVRQSVRHLHPFDGVGDQARLARRPANKPLHSGNFHRCQLSLLSYLTVVVFSVWVPWPRKCRVGANSPSRCPTMFSLMNTGTCLRPSWTATVCPTISGKIVDARAHVRTTRLSREAFSRAILSARLWSMYGPFFSDLDI